MKKSVTMKEEIVKLAAWTLGVYLFVNYVVRLFFVPTGSMAPTVNPGDLTVTNALTYTINEPQRGDVIVFEGEDKIFIKRIVGLPNDTISFVDGKVLINGEVLSEDYIASDVKTFSEDIFVVPEGHYFVLGDNRLNSRDSRDFEQPYIERSKIVAKLICVIPVSEVTDVFCAEQYKQNPEKYVLSSAVTILMNNLKS